MSFPQFDLTQWLLIVVATFFAGMSKSGLSGVNMIGILIFAGIFPARQSTGMLLVPLIVGDFAAIAVFRQHTDWSQLRRVILPAVGGVALGWWCLDMLSDHGLRITIGVVILALCALQLCRAKLGGWVEQTYHSRPFAWSLGGLGGWTTMIANAAGPVMTLFFLAMRLPKMAFVGTMAWFFCIINLVKAPFSIQLGLMTWSSLWLALVMSPVIVSGVLAGRWIIQKMPQHVFEMVVLVIAVIGALRLLF